MKITNLEKKLLEFIMQQHNVSIDSPRMLTLCMLEMNLPKKKAMELISKYKKTKK